MFKNRYWREYPLFLQVVLLLLMMFSFTSFFIAITQLLIPKLTGVAIGDIQNIAEGSQRPVINAALFSQALAATGIFLLPAVLFAYLTHPRPMQYLGLKKPGKSVHWLLVPLVMVGAITIFLLINSFFKQMNFGNDLKDVQDKHDSMVKAFLDMRSFTDFILSFAIMAILPAVSEEMIFRGIVMRLVHKRVHRIGLSIAISSLIFAIVHYDPAGLVAIFCAAILLGGIYYLTGSLWLSMLAHLLNNGLQIILIYLGAQNKALKEIVDGDKLPWQIAVAGAALFAISFYLLWKNRTPLPDNWSDDFAGEEREDNFTQA